MSATEQLGIQFPETYLPGPQVDLAKWAVIACDQHTSEPEYWQQVEQIVGDAPSTLNLIFPEAYLERPDADARIRRIQATMDDYLQGEVLRRHEGMIYVERRVDGKTRRGLLLCLDLEHYDFSAGSTSLVRPTEGTMVERLAPRIKVRDGGALELPHILVLIDDPDRRVIEAVGQEVAQRPPLYDFELMQGGGHVRGFAVDKAQEERVLSGLAALARPQDFAARYGVMADRPVLLFAVGDGNHSLATAKAIWDRMKGKVPMDHPARYALVEVENIHDAGVGFEPIHRVLFDVKRDVMSTLQEAFGETVRTRAVTGMPALEQAVADAQDAGRPAVGVVRPGGQFDVAEFIAPASALTVGSLQPFLDRLMSQGGAARLDYVHGNDVLLRLSSQPGNAGFFVPAIRKSELFRTVILEGTLPRKTFSMGEAHEKRFYIETRKIR